MDYKINHETFTSAISEVLAQGIDINQEYIFNHISLGCHKPLAGYYNTYSIPINNNNKKCLQVQIYNRGDHINTFELNMYIL